MQARLSPACCCRQGGSKGFALAFVIDLMCGLLSGGAIGEEVRPLSGDLSVSYDRASFVRSM